MLAIGSLAVGWNQAAPPVLAQTTNQSYDCGTYGAGSYGRNGCLAAVTTPAPPAPTGRLPVTGTQLGWIAVIGLGFVSLGTVLVLRGKRQPARHCH